MMSIDIRGEFLIGVKENQEIFEENYKSANNGIMGNILDQS